MAINVELSLNFFFFFLVGRSWKKNTKGVFDFHGPSRPVSNNGTMNKGAVHKDIVRPCTFQNMRMYIYIIFFHSLISCLLLG